MTILTQKSVYEKLPKTARTSSVVLTSEDLVNDGFISDYLNDECALTNKNLDSYEFLKVPSVIPKNAYPRQEPELFVVKPRKYTPSFWEPSKLVEDQIRPRIVEANSHLRGYWKPSEYTVRISRENTKQIKSKNLMQKVFGFFK